MNKTELERPREDREKREGFVRPPSPEQPLLRMVERRETGDYEALFALELEGVTKKKEAEAGKAEQESETDLFKRALISCLSDNHKLEFIYRSERNARGRIGFSWRIVGSATDSAPERAALRALQIWQGLTVLLGGSEREYRFAPIRKPENMPERTVEDGAWVGIVRPSGIGISAGARRKIGFAPKEETSGRPDTIVVPYASDKPSNSLDSAAIGASGCPAPVELVLSVAPFRLSPDELRKVGTALEWLQNGEPKRIKYHPEIEEAVEEAKILNGLKRNLAQWIKNPSGFRISCRAYSEQPIPMSFLMMAGRDIFNGCPVSVRMAKQEGDGDGESPEGLEVEALDLRGCVNEAAMLPPLFPKAATLMDCGVRRVYRRETMELPESGIVLGRIGDATTGRDVRFEQPDRSRHCYIVGATGTGKSTLLYNMAIQDIENGEGVAVIDPHGDLYHQLLESIPKHRVGDIVLVDPSDFEYSVGINFLECDASNKRVQMNFVVNEMIKIFDRLYDMRVAGGPIFEQYMRNAMLLVMDSDYPAATLMDVLLVFEEKKFRGFLLEKCKNPVVVNFWKRQAEEACGEASLKNLAPYITSKLNQFTTNALLRPIIGQQRSTVDFRELIDTGKILLVNLSKGLLGELDTQLLGMLVIGKIFTAAMGRAAVCSEHRKPLSLYVDEFQNFTTDTVAHLLSEARKFGLYLTLANQNLAQLSANSGKHSILDAVLGNVGTTLIFRLGAVDADKMQIYTRPELDAQDLQNLPDFHMAGRLLVKNCPSRPFVSKTLPNGKVLDCADIESIIEASRGKYAIPTEQVEQKIILRRESYKFNAGPNSLDED